jgi:hypothetical protein
MVIKRYSDGQETSGSTHRHLCAKLEGLDATWEIGCDVRGEADNLDHSGNDGSKIRGVLLVNESMSHVPHIPEQGGTYAQREIEREAEG